jgi:hypothetical protein
VATNSFRAGGRFVREQGLTGLSKEVVSTNEVIAR